MHKSCLQVVYKLWAEVGKVSKLYASPFSKSFLCVQINYLSKLFAQFVRDLYPAIFPLLTPVETHYSTASTTLITKETNLTKG